MVTFKAPPAGTIQRATPLNPITAIGKSIVGVFIGIVLILLLAPVVLWVAESQNTAKVFSFSEEVSSTSRASGYIRTMDIAKADSPIACYENKVEGNCLYYDYTLEELQYEVKDYCGKLQKDQQVIEEKGQKCRMDSNNEEKCEQCYLVNESNWNVVEQVTKFQSFSIGNFKVSYPSKAKVIGAEEYSKQIDATHKESMEYLKDNTQILVAGSSDGSTISDGGKKKFLLVSSMNYEATYDALKAQDRFIAWLLRATAFILLVLGYKMIFGPISLMSNFVRKIPLLGKWIDNATDFIIMLVSVLLAIVHFILLWILILLLKNIVIIAIVVAIGLGLFYLYTRFKKPPQQLPTVVAILVVVSVILFSQMYQLPKEDVTGYAVKFATKPNMSLEKFNFTNATKITCMDTDSGLNYSVNGTVTGIWRTTNKSQSWTDSCKNETTIQEGFCTDDGYAFYTTQECSGSTLCFVGACREGIVFLTSDDGYLYAIDLYTGTEIWKVWIEAQYSSPVVVDDIIYVGSGDDKLYALHVEDGSEVWVFDADNYVWTTPFVEDGIVYFGDGDGSVYAVDADDGSQLWKFIAGGRVVSSPLVANGVIYFGSWDYYVYALDAKDGTLRWKFLTGAPLWSSPAAGEKENIIYIGSRDGKVYALDADDGREHWNFEVDSGYVDSSPAVEPGVVYIGEGGAGHNIYALDAETGTELWRYTTYYTGHTVNDKPVVVKGILYFGSEDYVYALNAVTGAFLWTFRTRGDIEYASPAVESDVVYIGSGDSFLYALDANTGTQLWRFGTTAWTEIHTTPYVYSG